MRLTGDRQSARAVPSRQDEDRGAVQERLDLGEVREDQRELDGTAAIRVA